MLVDRASIGSVCRLVSLYILLVCVGLWCKGRHYCDASRYTIPQKCCIKQVRPQCDMRSRITVFDVTICYKICHITSQNVKYRAKYLSYRNYFVHLCYQIVHCGMPGAHIPMQPIHYIIRNESAHTPQKLQSPSRYAQNRARHQTHKRTFFSKTWQPNCVCVVSPPPCL